MNLIHEFSVKIIIFTFCLAFALEGSVLLFILLTSKDILNKVYDQTITNTENKTLEFTNSIKTLSRNLFMKTVNDLKLISRNIYLYNSPEKTLNKNSKIFSNNKEHKKIISANTEEIININDRFKDIFNNNTGRFDYLEYYINLYGNETNNSYLLNKLLKEHDELNYINYINYSDYSNIEQMTEEEENKIKYILIMLKTMYIKSFISRKSSMDLHHILIFSEKEMIIYPPEDPLKLYLYNYNSLNPITSCNYSFNDTGNYPSCIYNDIINNPLNSQDIITISEYYDYFSSFSGLCLRFPFIKERTNKSLICFEIEFIQTFNALQFNKAKHFEFGIFIPVPLSETQMDTMVLYNSNNKISILDLFALYNSTESTPGKYVIAFQEIGNISLTQNISTSSFNLISIYHYMYYDTTKVIKEHPELNVNITKLEEEFDFILLNIANFIYTNNTKDETLKFKFNRTICGKVLIGDKYECLVDEAEMILSPFSIDINNLDEFFLDKDELEKYQLNNLLLYAILETNPKSNKNRINVILVAKIARIIIFYFFITVIIFCFFILFLNIISEYSFKSVDLIIEQINKINIDDEKREINYLEEDKSWTANNEMLNLKGFYELMRRSLIIKQVFDKELYLKKHNLEFYKLTQDLEIKNIKEICNSFLAHFHFSNKIYNISENEFKSTINFIQENENKLKIGEYSKFDNIDENMLDIIYLKIFKQRFIYLYAMTKFKLGNEINSGNNPGTGNKNKTKKNKDKVINYFKDAIKYFQECKNINSSLGINQIKIIYSLIMISKSYVQLNDYKNAINNINEALSLFFEFSQTFKDYHSKIYNPKVMLFVESSIFHYILFTISRICITFNKPCASNWINLKIFETSPFLLSNIHYHAGISLHTFFDKNKSKMNKYDTNFYKNAKILKDYEKTKKYYGKLVSRLYNKNTNQISNKRTTTEKIGESHYLSSNKSPTITESVTDISKASSNLKKEMTTSKVSTAFQNRNKRLGKIVTFCMSEKILEKLNGQEFKDVLIKYFEKYFVMNDNDKFSFIQFADNGKKTAFFKPEPLNYFLLKFQKTKGTFELTDSFMTNTSSIFMELYNILDSIIKNYSSSEENDNIIMIFMDPEDIRFSSMDDCFSIVEDLNKKNASVYFFAYDENIKEEKVNNIQSFLNGLIEGYFFHIKNYQQLKQIFINISTIKSQSSFFSFDYNLFEQTI